MLGGASDAVEDVVREVGAEDDDKEEEDNEEEEEEDND